MAIFMFYSRSSGKPYPGLGAQEQLLPDERERGVFDELSKIKDWRKMLSNFWLSKSKSGKINAQFELDSHSLASVEHALAFQLLKNTGLEGWQELAMESGSELSLNPARARKALRAAKEDAGIKALWHASKAQWLTRALKAKFEQGSALGRMLVLTKNARLTHWLRGKPQKIEPRLERVRDSLRNTSS